jgi:hypothetical protein
LLANDDTLQRGDLFESNRQLLLATHGTAAMQLGRQIERTFDYPGALATVREPSAASPEKFMRRNLMNQSTEF